MTPSFYNELSRNCVETVSKNYNLKNFITIWKPFFLEKMISIFTTYTNPEQRNDPYIEALKCYEEFADEVIITGKIGPMNFLGKKLGKTFQDGFNKVNGDWAIRMDIDYFFHEKDFKKIKEKLNKYKEYPAVSFPQYQFFTPRNYHLKTRLCIALNKKKFPDIKLNGGGDLLFSHS